MESEGRYSLWGRQKMSWPESESATTVARTTAPVFLTIINCVNKNNIKIGLNSFPVSLKTLPQILCAIHLTYCALSLYFVPILSIFNLKFLCAKVMTDFLHSSPTLNKYWVITLLPCYQLSVSHEVELFSHP